MKDTINIDEINDIMTVFLDNLVSIAKIHTDYKEKLGEKHEYTKLANSLVRIFNQYQSLYVYINDQEAYANELTIVSKLALDALSFIPYELKEGRFFKKRKELKNEKDARDKALKELNKQIEKINNIIDNDVKKEESLEEE